MYTVREKFGKVIMSNGARTEYPRTRTRRRNRRGRVTGVRASRRDRVLLWLAVVPAIAILGFAQAYPLLYSLWVSFQHWSLSESLTSQGFVGLANYTDLFASPDFLSALRLSAIFLCTVPVELAIGFLLAYFTQGDGLRMRVVRTVLIIPMIVAPIAVGTMFRLLLDPQSGFLVLAMHAVGLPDVNWLGSQNPALVTVLGADIWEWVPFSMILYTAALTGLDQNLIEAAHLDGASSLQVIRRVIWPLMLPTSAVIGVFRVIDAFLVVDVIVSLTNGGPGTATQTSALWIFYKAIQFFDLSQAAAGSWLILVICLLMAFAVLRLRGLAHRRLRGTR